MSRYDTRQAHHGKMMRKIDHEQELVGAFTKVVAVYDAWHSNRIADIPDMSEQVAVISVNYLILEEEQRGWLQQIFLRKPPTRYPDDKFPKWVDDLLEIIREFYRTARIERSSFYTFDK